MAGKKRRNQGGEAVAPNSPQGMFAGGAATKIYSSQQDAGSGILGGVQGKSLAGCPPGIVAPIIEDHVAVTRALDAFEKLFGNNLVGIDVVTVEHGHDPRMIDETLHFQILVLRACFKKRESN